MSEYIPGYTYRDSVPIPDPSFMFKLKNHMSNWWGGWLFGFFIVSALLFTIGAVISYNNHVELCHSYALVFLEKNGVKNINTVNTWYGTFQVGSGCLGKDYATNVTGEVNGKYLEATACCSRGGECKFLRYDLEK